jgi:dihydroflavonol-4-reductase
MSNADHGSKRLWIGGATGFLGAHLVQVLREQGHELVLAARSGGEVCGVRVQSVDVLDAQAVENSARGCDGAFLATGKVSRDRDAGEELHRAHVLATRSALSGLRAAGVPRVVVASTSGTIAVSGSADQIADESGKVPLELVAMWPYYRSKLYAEREALEANAPGFEVVLVNPSLLLGPGDTRESSTGDLRRFLERAIPAVPGGGIAFVDVRDAARGMWHAFERGRAGERYILNAKNMTVAAFFQRLERISGVKAPAMRMPRSRPLAIGVNRLFSKALRAIGGEPPVDEISVEMAQYFWYCSAAKAERELGFEARDPGETLRETIADLIARKVVFPKRSSSAPASASYQR